jgi:Carboxypeptidase regulatory-like domain/TonB dependent receptor
MNKSCNRILTALVLGVCLCFAAMVLGSPLAAQSTFGSITGTVADPSGSAVPDALVTLTSVATTAKQTFTTGSDGQYTFVNLNPGPYVIEVDKAGFKHVKRTDIDVQVQIGTRIDVALEVGAQTQTVEVTAETPLLQPTSSSLGQIVDERKTNEIPLNGRNVFNLITLSPAAVAQGGSGGTPVGQNPFSWGNYQVGGSFANQSAEYLDGQPLNIGYINLPIIIPTQDSISEFKVEYNNVGAEWGKFSGGVVNLSTKSGGNAYHGEAYEYLRNKVLNATPYFTSENPPYVQNQYGGNFGGHIIKDKTFFFVSWEQFRLRQGGSTSTTTVPVPAMINNGDFSSLCPGISPTGVCSPAEIAAGGIQIYDPYTYGATTPGQRNPYLGNQIPSTEWNQAAQALYAKLYPAPNAAGIQNGTLNNFVVSPSTGGNTNQIMTRIDQNINSTTRLFGRYAYFGLTDLPDNPYDTGLCADRCTELYHTNVLAVDLNHQFSTTTIFDFNAAVSRFVYQRAPINAGYDLTDLGWNANYNDLSASLRTPPTPAFPFPSDVGKSQGAGSVIGDHNTQYNFSPTLTLIRGKHSIALGAQWTLGYDNYVQTNIASGAFAFSGIWTGATASSVGAPFADFLLGLAQNQGSFVNQTEGVAQVPAQTAGLQSYRALFAQDTYRVSQKLTLTLGLRYELQGTWSERFNRLSYFDPNAVNATVSGCNGVGGPCTGDAFLVGTGVNGSRNSFPLDKREWSPRIGAAYSFDQKTVIRAGYGIFWVPNYVNFGANPDNDVINLATTPFTATTNAYQSPFSTLNATGCNSTGAGFAAFIASCTDTGGPFGSAGIVEPPGRNAVPSTSAFVAANGSPTLNPWTNPKEAYVQQYNLDVQREVGWGWFIDAAYAGSHGIHLGNFNPSVNINQIPDAFVEQAAAQEAAALPVTIATKVPNPLIGSPNASLNPVVTPMIFQGQLDRPYPQYNALALAGVGCCESNYNSFQMTATKRFKNGGSFLAAYTNAKLMSNTDTQTSWLEGSTGGVGQVQDYNNLRGERSLSSQDVSQRLVISYVYDLPFGHGQRYMGDATGVMNKLVSGWGVDGITTFQKGFPLKFTYAASTPLETLGLGISNIRPSVVAGCNKGAGGSGSQAAKLNEWFNTSCFEAPPDYGYGNEARVDSSLRSAGINNWDLALFKTTNFGPEERYGIQFRTEFFNTFNRVQFGFPGTGFNGDPTQNGFGIVTNQLNNPRLIQFALKFMF